MAAHTLVTAMFWFHPAVWWIRRCLLEERELACDEGVLEAGTDPEVYAGSIVETCRFSLESPSPCLSELSGADLNRRVISILEVRAKKLSPLGKTWLLASGLLLVAVPVAYGVVKGTPFLGQILHASGPLPAFEVVSIKPWKAQPRPAPPADGAPPPKIVMEIPVGDQGQHTNSVHLIGQASVLMMSAYRLPFDPVKRIVGAPAWADSQEDRYEILAKIDDAHFASMQKMTKTEQTNQVALMEQALLADRFKLKAHFETVEMPIYALVVAKGGPRLVSAKEGERSRLANLDTEEGSLTTATAVTLAEFSKFPLLRAGREIVDRTGLDGRYNFTLKWSVDGGISPSLVTAMEQQLGLKLVPTKGPVEIIVIDHIERPSEN